MQAMEAVLHTQTILLMATNIKIDKERAKKPATSQQTDKTGDTSKVKSADVAFYLLLGIMALAIVVLFVLFLG